jgi:hypothetical protein
MQYDPAQPLLCFSYCSTYTTSGALAFFATYFTRKTSGHCLVTFIDEIYFSFLLLNALSLTTLPPLSLFSRSSIRFERVHSYIHWFSSHTLPTLAHDARRYVLLQKPTYCQYQRKSLRSSASAIQLTSPRLLSYLYCSRINILVPWFFPATTLYAYLVPYTRIFCLTFIISVHLPFRSWQYPSTWQIPINFGMVDLLETCWNNFILVHFDSF